MTTVMTLIFQYLILLIQHSCILDEIYKETSVLVIASPMVAIYHKLVGPYAK
jgi:hypothetical protein